MKAEAIAGTQQPRSKYHREIKPGIFVDVYDVLAAWQVDNPALQHPVKKALQRGARAGDRVMRTDTAILARALRILANDIQSEDGVANAAILEAAERLEELAKANTELRAALDFYATSSNWRREMRIAGSQRNWIKCRAAFDRGALAKFTLAMLEGKR